MKARSPVLGYNHNVRYRGRLWHVQTEDSGASHPHVITHLFHDGTIIATKRLDYDATSEVGVVQKLMQAQHKAIMRELKRGGFDEKIVKLVGPFEPSSEEEGTSDFDVGPKTDPNVDLLVLDDDDTVKMAMSLPANDSSALKLSGKQPPPLPPPIPTPAAAPESLAAAAIGVGGRRSTGSQYPQLGEESVVARPAVIVGAAEIAEPPRQRSSTLQNVFGTDASSGRSLDEVILAYLSEDLVEP